METRATTNDGGIPAWARVFYSEPRLGRYLDACGHDGPATMELYSWNAQVAGAFYDPLHKLEIGLRNHIHVQMKLFIKSEHWWTAINLHPVAHNKTTVALARAGGKSRHAGRARADDVVAESSFGFWVSLLASRYDRQLWIPALRKAFPNFTGRRSDLHRGFDSVRLLRNRIMHYEPVFHRDLNADHAKIIRLMSYLNLDAAEELKRTSIVPEVLAQRPPRRGQG
ncbi:hypothetical protein LX16_4663 [Stackebrandtia albiflava]|uniref:Abi-like protein n=1 Tax=Stackebrandtia albiflava TaxID=406432 RepID=A0A562UQJ0_9ACTN|nr:hypothetical protein [Stackebrandtia albiflava]TWJ07881.1 hypothetical protein LX16_4663 [Stackebrandtia albiflava]